MKKTETKPSEAENGLELEAKELTADEKADRLAAELGAQCEDVRIDPRFPMCVVGNATNILHRRGVKRVLIIKEME